MGSAPTHTPVLVEQVSAFLRPEAGPGWFVDGTVGLGGHAEALLEAGHPELRILGFDRDAESLTLARKRLRRWGDRVVLEHRDFREGPDRLKLSGSTARSVDGCWTSGSAPCTWTEPSAASPSRRRVPST